MICLPHRLTFTYFGIFLVFVYSAAWSQEITLKAVNAFPEGTYYARNFERFVKRVNEEGKGLVQIHYIGGPKAIPTF